MKMLSTLLVKHSDSTFFFSFPAHLVQMRGLLIVLCGKLSLLRSAW